MQPVRILIRRRRSQLVLIICTRFVNQPVRQIVRHFKGFVFVEAVFGDQSGKESAIHAAGHVVPRGNGEEGAGIVVEADRVVEARRLRDLFAEAHHAFGAVVKPPGRAKAQAGIMSGERREFAAVGGFVEREENDA